MSKQGDRRFWLVLGSITAAALAWRVFYVIWQRGRITLNGDAAYYHWQSIDLSRGLGFLDPGMYEFYGRVTPSAGHPPAYLVYLAGVSKFIGTTETTHRLASTLLGAAAVFTIGVLARRVFSSDAAGWLAAGLAAVYAHLWINDEMLMSESMYVFTSALAVLAAYRFWDRRTVASAAVMGAAVSLAVLSRAEALALFPFMVLPLALLLKERSWPDRIKVAAVAGIAGAAVMSPWVVYNVTRFEHPVLLSNGAGSVLMVANCDYTDDNTGEYAGTYDGAYVGYWSIFCAADMPERIRAYFPKEREEELLAELGPVAFPNGHTTHWFGDESTHEVAWRALGLEEMDRHRGDLPRVAAIRVLRMWDFFRPWQNVDPLNAEFEGRGLWQSQVANVQYYPLLGFSIVGLVALRRRKVPIIPFVAFAAMVTITAATAFGITRYRAPVDGLLPVLAAGGALAVFKLVWPKLQGNRFALQLAIVTLGALALRVAYVLIARHDAVVGGDSIAYHTGANLLAQGHGFIDGFRFGLTGLERPSAAHPPLYTVYLGGWSFIGLDGPLAQRIVSTFLGTATVLVVGLVARRLAGERAGIVAAVCAALYPHLWLNDGALLSESAAALAVALSLLAIERYRERPDFARAAEVGGAFALAALTRAELVLLFPLVALPLLFGVGDRDTRQRLFRLGVGAAVSIALVGPWVVHNLTRFEKPVTLSNGLGATMLGGSCDAAFYGDRLGYWSDQCPTVEVEAGDGPAPDATPEEVRAYLREYVEHEPDESERDVAAREAAIDYISEHKGRYVVVAAARVGRIWNVFRPAQGVRFDADIEGRGRAAAWAAFGAYFLLMPLAIAGLVVLRRRGHPIWPYLVLAGIVSFSAAITFGIQRYRLPVDVALPILAGVGVDAWLSRRQSSVPQPTMESATVP